MPDLHRLPARIGRGLVRVVVESPRGSSIKLKYDPEQGVFTMSRPLILGLTYPFDFGFVPGTIAPDGDPLDALVLTSAPSYPGVVFTCRVVGVVKVTQAAKRGKKERERNDRIIAVPQRSIQFEELTDARALPGRVRKEIEAFFCTAVLLEGKGVELAGWGGPAAAVALVEKTARAFEEHERTSG